MILNKQHCIGTKIKHEGTHFCQPISEGLFDEPVDKYHAVKAIGSTLLRVFMESPAQFTHLWLGGEKKTSDAFTVGSALHCLMLEPAEFESRFVCSPVDINRRTKVGKEQWSNFCTDNAGKEILTPDQLSSVLKMSNNIRESSLARDLLTDTSKEKSARVRLSNGLVVQCRPDAIKDNTIIDIKTCSNVGRFRYDVKAHGYHIQAALYYFILSSIFPDQYKDADFYFIAVDKTDISEVIVVGLDNTSLRSILAETVRPALYELGVFFSQVPGGNDLNTQQSEMKWLNIT